VQVGTAVGIGLLTVLTGALNTNFVINGKDTVVEAGKITFQTVLVGLGKKCIHCNQLDTLLVLLTS
jgi:xanthine/uracil/vitamin C permease (AzgA family)